MYLKPLPDYNNQEKPTDSPYLFSPTAKFMCSVAGEKCSWYMIPTQKSKEKEGIVHQIDPYQS